MTEMGLTEFYVFLGLIIFCIGVFGFLSRRSGLMALMCLELMLNGVNLVLMGFSYQHGLADGPALFLFIVLVAAAEAALGLSLLVALFRNTGSVWLEDFRRLKG